MARRWWIPVVRGILAFLFGVLAFIWPGITLAVLVLLFGAYVFVDGIFAFVLGGMLIGLGFKVRHLREHRQEVKVG